MKFREQLTYPVSPEELFEILWNESPLRQKFEELGHQDFRVLERQDGPQELRLRATRQVPTDVPGFARKFLAPMNTVVQTDCWSLPEDGVRHGTWEVEVQGAPIRMHGTTTIEPDGEGCRQMVEGKIEVKIPIIGGKIAQFVASDAVKSIGAEQQANLKLLARGGA